MKHFPLWHLALVAVLCILAYANSLSGAFLWDDEIQIVKNESLRSLSNIPEAFTTSFWGFAHQGQPNQLHFYRPLQTVAYTLAYWWGGLSPTPGHVISLTLHTLASIFVYLICVELGLAGIYALLAAGLFATHPVHTEAVSWIAGTPDVACGAFYFAAFWAFLRSKAGADRVWLILSALLLLLALFSKEMAITLPALALLYTFRPGAPDMKTAQRIVLLIPYAAVSAVYLAMRINALGFIATTHTAIDASFIDWISLGFRVFGEYIQLALAPYPLIAFHMVEIHFADRVLPSLGALAFVALLVGIVWKFRARFPEAWFWFAAFALLLVPVFYFKGLSNILFAERYLYIPSLAAILAVVTVLARLPSKHLWMAWAVVGLFAVLTLARNRDWRDAEHLYTTTLDRDPNVPLFQISLADILLNRGDDGNAARHLNRALESLGDARYIQIPYEIYRAHVGLGAILARAHNYPGAREHLEAARKVMPDGEWPYLYLGGIAMEADNDMPKAIEQFQTAARLGPLNEVARDYLGIAYYNLGRFQEAKVAFEDALRINPTHKDALAHLEMAKRSLASPAGGP